MKEGYLFLFILLSIGLLAKSDLLVIASIILGLLKLVRVRLAFTILDNIVIKVGLIFLLLSVLSPLINGDISIGEVLKSYKSILAIFALISGILATQLVGMGIDLLDSEPELIVGMLFGSIVGIVFFGGVPVGPLLAGGLTAFFYRLYSLFN